MEDASKLLTSIAALVGAAAWPAVFLTALIILRNELKQVFAKLPNIIDKVKKATLPGLTLELERIAQQEIEQNADLAGAITPSQVEASARISIESRKLDLQSITDILDKLCLEYDTLRRTLKSGIDRTRALTKVLVQMRSLAPSAVPFLDVYKSSSSAGSRLAAVAMMQMVPQCSDLEWLKARFSVEQPFVFYHAALALQNFANTLTNEQGFDQLRHVVAEALETVRKFSGMSDRGTIDVLESLFEEIRKK